MALKKILQEGSVGAERQRACWRTSWPPSTPASSRRGCSRGGDIQKDIAWSALRKIIKMRLEELESIDEDVRLEAMDRLLDLVVTGIERGKDNTVVQILENVSRGSSSRATPTLSTRG